MEFTAEQIAHKMEWLIRDLDRIDQTPGMPERIATIAKRIWSDINRPVTDRLLEIDALLFGWRVGAGGEDGPLDVTAAEDTIHGMLRVLR